MDEPIRLRRPDDGSPVYTQCPACLLTIEVDAPHICHAPDRTFVVDHSNNAVIVTAPYPVTVLSPEDARTLAAQLTRHADSVQHPTR